MKKLLLSIVALFIVATTFGQAMQIPAIPADKEVRSGVLPNGMKYYLRHNDKQKNLADFYIVHNVGAIQENDDQQGLAHFLEHMAFNGTKNLPGKMLIEYLEKIGVKFGTNLNASTSWDVTQYLMKDVPTIREGIIDSAMLVLHDWSHFIALEPKEIDSERGVIMEELRTRDGASWRSQIAMIKALTKGTKYEHRNLIGYLDGLKSFDHSSIENFYRTWYRPDYQGVVIVGDIDVDVIENKIKALMADIPTAPEGSPEKEVIVVPDNEEPIISIFEDKEMSRSSASLMIKHQALPTEYNNTIVAESLDVVQNLGEAMANTRLSEIAMKPDAPFMGAGINVGGIGICKTLEVLSANAVTKDGELLRGLEAVLVELKRIKEFGFTDSELERAKADLLSRLESAYNNRNDRKNREYVYRLISAFKNNAAYPDAETEWQIDQQIINSITVDQINKLFASYITPSNQVYIVNAPIKEGLVNPTKEQLLEIVNKVENTQVEGYKDDTVKEPLIENEKLLKGSPVKKEVINDALGTTEWTLKNGVKVVVKPTTFKANEVLLNVESKRGTSCLADADYNTAQMYADIVSQMGVSKFSATNLKKQLTGKNVKLSSSLDDYSVSISGSSTPKDFETLLQLLYLNATAPRFDKADFDIVINRYKSFVANLATNPDYQMSIEQTKTLYNNNPRRQTLTMKTLEDINFDRLAPIHKALLSNAADFTFTIVGNVDLAVIKPLIEKYIGSLPIAKVAKNIDDNIRLAKGVNTNDFKAEMQQPKVSIFRAFSGDIEYSVANTVKMNVLAQILRSRYTTSIREEKGGTYGVGVSGGIRSSFEKSCYYMLVTSFDTNEEMADELTEIIVKEIKDLANDGPKSEDLEKVREYLLKDWKNQLENNGNWLSWIRTYYYRGINRVAEYENVVKSITGEDIKILAAKILADNNMCYVVMRPQK